MAVKADNPPSNSGETTSLLSNQPPSYQASTAPQPQIYPSLPTSSTHPAGPSPYHSLPPPRPIHSQASAMEAADRRARSRFFQALLWGVGIWVGLGLITGGIVSDEMSFRNRRRGGWSNGSGSGTGTGSRHQRGDCRGFVERDIVEESYFKPKYLYPVPFLVKDFVTPTTTTTSSSISYLVPLTQPTFFINTNGGSASGSVNIFTDPASSSQVRVDVNAEKFGSSSLWEDVKVCRLEDGVELWTPNRNFPSSTILKFTINLYLPTSFTPDPILTALNITTSNFRVSSSSTSLPLLSSYSIITSNSPIVLTNVTAVDSIFLKTSNAPITITTIAEARESFKAFSSSGKITAGKIVSKDIEVKTSNGELSGTIEVGKRFVGKTSNANVDLRVALVDEEEFSVDIQSSNKNVHVVYVEQPRGSSLNSFVRTSNGKIRVDHDSHFSGEFLVTTSNAPATLQGPFTQIDPEDPSRKREIEVSAGAGKTVSGRVWWDGDESKGRGRSEVRTSNAVAGIVFE